MDFCCCKGFPYYEKKPEESEGLEIDRVDPSLEEDEEEPVPHGQEEGLPQVPLQEDLCLQLPGSPTVTWTPVWQELIAKKSKVVAPLIKDPTLCFVPKLFIYKARDLMLSPFPCLPTLPYQHHLGGTT